MRSIRVAMAVAVALAAAGCAGKPEPTDSPAPSSSASAAPTRLAVRSLTDREVAVAYLKAMWSGDYRDPNAGSWLPRIKPYASPKLYARQRKLHSGSTGSGVAWMDIKKDKLIPRFRLSGTEIEQKQPSGPKTHFVQVAFSVVHVTKTGDRPAPSVRMDTDMPATKKVMRLDRTSAGWRVTDDEVGDGSGVGG
jgi:hypothetical protein